MRPAAIAFLALGIVCGAALCALGQSAARGNPQEVFERGEKLLRDGQLEEAARSFHAVLAIDPSVAGAYANLGVIEMRRKKWGAALADLRKAENLAPGVAGIRLNIGLVYFHEEEYSAAIAPFESVVRDAPDAEQARYLLGLCDFFTQRYAETAEALEPLWERERSNLSYLYVLGISAGEAKSGELEEKALGRLVEVGGDTPEIHLLMGKAMLNRNDFAKAESELKQAEAANPKLPFVHLYLGIAEMRLNKFEEARGEFESGVKSEPEVAYYYDELGALSSVQRKEADAEKYFRIAIERDPRIASAQFGLGEILQRQGKFKESLAALDAAARYAPDSRNVHYLRGRVLKRLGREDEAKKEFAEAQRLFDKGLARDAGIMREKVTPEPELRKAPE